MPFVILTGYDQDVSPDVLRDIVRSRKPLPFRAVAEAMGQF